MSENKHELNCLKSQAYGTGCSCGVEPVASPQATRLKHKPVVSKCPRCGATSDEEAGRICIPSDDGCPMTEEYEFAANPAAPPAAGTTPLEGGIGREDAGSPAERQQTSNLHNEGSSPSSPSNWADTWPGYKLCKCGDYHCDHGGKEDSCGVLGCKCKKFESSEGTTPQAERICGNCGLPLVQGETEQMCRELDKVSTRLEKARAVAPVDHLEKLPTFSKPSAPVETTDIPERLWCSYPDCPCEREHDGVCQYKRAVATFQREVSWDDAYLILQILKGGK